MAPLVGSSPPDRGAEPQPRTPRIALLTAAGPWSGVEVHTLDLAKHLRARGHHVTIVELGRRVYTELGLDVTGETMPVYLGHSPTESVPLEMVSFAAWLRIFKAIPADLAICAKGTFKFASLAMEAAARIRFPRFCVIEHLHAPLGPRPNGIRMTTGGIPSLGLWWYRSRFQGYLRSVFPHRVFCVSDAVAKSLRADYGYRASKLAVMYAGVDIERFTVNPVARHESRASWGISDSALVFGSVGRLSAMKNHELLVRAFARLVAANPYLDARLVIVGEGPKRSALDALVASLGMASRVALPGFCSATERACASFDVFCLSSGVGESFGIALLEGMAAGCPAIATAVGGVPEILNDPEIGWLIPAGDEEALARALQSAALLDRRRLELMGAAARASVARRFSAEQRWACWVEAIEQVVIGSRH